MMEAQCQTFVLSARAMVLRKFVYEPTGQLVSRATMLLKPSNIIICANTIASWPSAIDTSTVLNNMLMIQTLRVDVLLSNEMN